MRGTIKERFWAKVNKNGPVHPVLKTRCWLWVGACMKNGYGHMYVDGRLESANRISWFLNTGRWPTLFALHKCDNRACIRHSHLWDGSQSDNIKDACRKGRVKSPSKKLSDYQVTALKRSVSNGRSQTSVATKYGITQGAVSNIILGKRRTQNELQAGSPHW